jgi:hypothetical protein
MSEVEAERLRLAEAKVAALEQAERDRLKAKAQFNLQTLVVLIGTAASMLVSRLLH